MAVSVPSSIRVLLPGGLVKKLGLEEYVRGVVASALPADAPIEALKAQAVAARTFAANTRRHIERGADVCTLRHCQVWSESGTAAAERAASETRGIVAVHGGRLIDAYYFEHCDGSTRDAAGVLVQAPPYLLGVTCPCGFSTLKGHGIGMCQRGAQVMARFGDGFDVILKHYFTDISLERAGLLPAPLPMGKPATEPGKPARSITSTQPSGPDIKPTLKSRRVVRSPKAPRAKKNEVSPTRSPESPRPPELPVPTPAPDRVNLVPPTSKAKVAEAAPPKVQSDSPPSGPAVAPESVQAPQQTTASQAEAPAALPVQVASSPVVESPAPRSEPFTSPAPAPPPDHPEPLAQAAKPGPSKTPLTQPPPAEANAAAAQVEEEMWYPLPDESLLRADAIGAEEVDEELRELGQAVPPTPRAQEDLPEAPKITHITIEELIQLPPAPETMPEEMPFFAVQVVPVEPLPAAPPPPLVEEETLGSVGMSAPSPVLVDRLPGPRMIAGDLAAPGIIVTIRDVEGHAIVTVSGTALHHGHGGFEAPVSADGIYAVTFEQGALDVDLQNETVFIQVAK